MTAKIKNRGPLAGVRVVDLTSMVFGPYCTQIMADMGADVIKVEAPAGDNTRYINAGPAPGLGGIFININRGKRSIVLDLRKDRDRAALDRLIVTADVFIHSMRGKAIAGLGFDYEAVRRLRPGIVYVNCYGYSRRGPYADRPAYDDTIQAECGLTHVMQLMSGEPQFVPTIMADKIAGLAGLQATLLALFHRERTGEGQEVEVGMFETLTSFMLTEHGSNRMFDPPLGPAHYQRAVSRNRKPYQTRDGYIAALVYNDKHWNAFMEEVRPSWASDEFATLEQRARQIDHVYELLASTFIERTTQEWLDVLERLHIPAVRPRALDDLFEDEHLEAIGFFEKVDTEQGSVRFPGVPAWFSETPGHVGAGAPLLGEHTDEILEELGMRR
ncbi:MAG: CoA transferase [Sphingomonadales bacterium]|nr:CoA transferase [Sphingomonadales bacterium]